MIGVATHLGELGQPRQPVDITFNYFGEQIRVNPYASDLHLLSFLERAAGLQPNNDVATMHATKTFLNTQIHAEDFARFWTTAVANAQQFDDLLEVAKAIVVAVARFPTGRLSDSSGGQPSTATRSRDSYASAVRQSLVDMKHRPDLRMMVYQAHQDRKAAAAAATAPQTSAA